MATLKLDREKILAEALRVLENEGLAQVSLRRLAKGLNAGASSIYWHVKDKDELYALMSEAIYLDCIRAVPNVSTREEWLREFGLALWRTQTRTPDVHQLITQSPIREERQNAADQLLIDRWVEMGGADGDLALRAVKALVTGWTTLSPRFPGRLADDEKDFRAALDILVHGCSTREDAARLAENA